MWKMNWDLTVIKQLSTNSVGEVYLNPCSFLYPGVSLVWCQGYYFPQTSWNWNLDPGNWVVTSSPCEIYTPKSFRSGILYIGSSQTVMSLCFSWGSCANADSNFVGLEWSLKICISKELPDAAKAADPQTTLCVNRLLCHPEAKAWSPVSSASSSASLYIESRVC